jgi:hypothetical protein
VTEPWGDRPAPEEARHSEIDVPGGDIDQTDDDATDGLDDLHGRDDDTDDTDHGADVEVDDGPGDDGPGDDGPGDEGPVGDGPVATAVARLDSLVDLPPAEHVEVYEDVHRVLQDALADAAHDSGGDGGGADGSGEDRTGSP